MYLETFKVEVDCTVDGAPVLEYGFEASSTLHQDFSEIALGTTGET